MQECSRAHRCVHVRTFMCYFQLRLSNERIKMQRLHFFRAVGVSCVLCASSCVLLSTHTYLSTQCERERRWREGGLFRQWKQKAGKKMQRGGRIKKCFRTTCYQKHIDHDFGRPPSGLLVLWRSHVIQMISASHPSSPLPALHLCSNPSRLTAWLSPPTTTTKSPHFSLCMCPTTFLPPLPPTPAVLWQQRQDDDRVSQRGGWLTSVQERKKLARGKTIKNPRRQQCAFTYVS